MLLSNKKEKGEGLIMLIENRLPNKTIKNYMSYKVHLYTY